MRKRPLSWVIIGWLFIIVGGGLAIRCGLSLMQAVAPGTRAEWTRHDSMDAGLVFISAVLALLGGAFLLRGANWARWVCLVWMGLHVVLSLFHDWEELLVHAMLFGLILYGLFAPRRAA